MAITALPIFTLSNPQNRAGNNTPDTSATPIATLKYTSFAGVELPSYIPDHQFKKLSSFAQKMVISLLLEPPEPPAAYDLEAGRKAGFTDYTHYRIASILEHALYD
jgi:hypothetical protein